MNPARGAYVSLDSRGYPGSTVGYWSSGSLDYALVAKARSDAIQSIAEDVAKDI